MKQSISFTLCLLLAFVSKAQLHVDFTADITAGCSPIVVNFQNLSTGIDNGTKYFWDLGNGGTSENKNPSATYLEPGVYKVSLRVTTSLGIDSLAKDAFISVYGKPQIAFETNMRMGCSPTTIQFKDMTEPAPGTANTTWNWDFGDGTSSTEKNPVHVYNTPGNYGITLSVTSDKGCGDLHNEPEYINIVPGVKAQFSNTQQTVCNPPVSINFNNTSTGPETLTYLWDFGNGTTSTEIAPSATYSTVGSFPVKLVVHSTFGCSDSVVVQDAVKINSAQLTTNFQALSVCTSTEVQLFDSSSAGVISRLWTFSDGTTDTTRNPIKTFPSPGKYVISLINNYGTCVDSVSKSLELGVQPEINIEASPRNSCQLPLSVTFTNNSTNGSSYKWNFGDGTVSSETAPVHTYTKNGSYTVSLIATNANGCTDTITNPAYINIQQPVVYFKDLPEWGCIPHSVQFNDSVISADPIVSYKWNLGDGTTSTEKAPEHKYTKQGTYPISLTVVTATGCTASSTVPNGVKVGTKPEKVDFTFDTNIVCASRPINFKDASKNVDSWDWSFGDGSSSYEKDPSHLFTNIGIDTVTLKAYNSGCKGDEVKKAVIIKAPIAMFSARIASCTDRMTYIFKNASITGDTTNIIWKWDFGDSTTSDQRNPEPHTYPGVGNYRVSLFVTNGECSYIAQQNISITPRTTDFEADTRNGCKLFTPKFTPSDLGNQQITAYTWNFGDGTSNVSTGAINHTYKQSGDYDVSLITTDIFGCNDTSAVKTKYIRVNGPVAKFAATNTKGCAGLTTNFSDLSTSDGQNAITQWEWDFGDSSQQIYSAPPFEHSYTTVGRYNVKLIVQDAAGCIDSVKYLDYVKTSELNADWTGIQKTCPGAPIQFTRVTNTPVTTSLWDFGNGNTSNDLNPIIAYADTGTYTIKLLLMDSLGCKDSVIKDRYTQVYRPIAGFTENNLTSYCLPFQAQFTNTSTYIDSSFWNLGIGTSTQRNPVSIYTNVGTYHIQLRVVSPGGCMDTIDKVVNVYNIEDAKLNYGPTTVGCLPFKVDFTAFTDMKGRFIWDFGDGSVVDTTKNTITHTFTNAGSFTPKIILQEPSGCVVAITGSTPIVVSGAKVKFGIDKKFFCDSGLIRIFDSTVALGSNVNYSWDFGDGTTSDLAKPGSHFYNQPGWHPIKLTVKTEGCIDSMSIRPGVRIAATPRFHISGDPVGCVNTVIQSRGVLENGDSADISWMWQLPDGSTSNVQAPPDMQFASPGTFTYKATATNSEGCADTALKTVIVRPRSNGTANFTSPITIQAGYPVKLEGTYPANTKSYLWQPTEGLSCSDCSFPEAGPFINTKYIVQYTDTNNCRSTATVQVYVLCDNAEVFIPNTFSPNGDGSNDVFYVRGRGMNRVKSLRIFDRWGEVVYEKRDIAVNEPSTGWDGRFKGKKPKADVYIYQVEVFCGNNNIIKFNGNVALIQ